MVAGLVRRFRAWSGGLLRRFLDRWEPVMEWDHKRTRLKPGRFPPEPPRSDLEQSLMTLYFMDPDVRAKIALWAQEVA